MTQPNSSNIVPNSEPPAEPAPAPTVAPTIPSDNQDLQRQLHPYQRWLVVLVAVTLGAACLLVSAGHGAKEGTRQWSPNSALRVIVELLNFNYAYPTPRGNDVKWLAQGLGAAAALVTAGIMWYIRTGRRRDDEPSGAAPAPASDPVAPVKPKPFLEHLSLVAAAQIALVAYGIWAIWSYRWAHWPAAALGEGIRNLIVIIWAVAIARAMNRWSALRAGAGVALILAITAGLGIWYHYERNPVLRLEFPIGNPIFFAACMLPALLLALAGIAGALESLVRRPAHNTATRKIGTAGRGPSPVWVLLASMVVFIIVAYAFVLTDSRSPAVALAAALAFGGAALVVRWLPRERRRLAVLAFAGFALAMVLFVGRPWLESQKTVAAGGRGASFRMRFYAWEYAKELFLSQPLTGRGQASYLCLSQGLSCRPRDQWGRSDVEKDPSVFTSGFVGHAHNEWLEILADLGAVGFALMATALGLTFWAGGKAFMRAQEPAEKWFILALVAALLAMVVEECADVALRMPVFPLVFYTIVGLLWAFSTDPRQKAALLPPRAAWLPVGGLLAAILGGMMITSAVRRDFRGAVADGGVPELLEKRQWDAAFAQARLAGENRLVVESQISAGLHMAEASHAAAAACFQQFRAMLARQSDAAGRTRIRKLAEEDVARFDRYGQECLAAGKAMWDRMPGIHSVADWMAEVLMMKQELESLKQQLGLQPEQAPFLQKARECLQMEYLRDRLNAAAALRLLQFSGDQPVDARIDLLRIPLRGGPEPVGSLPAVEAALRQMPADKSGFPRFLDALVKRAEPALAQADPDRWADPYAPESLRLKAMVERISGRYESAVGFAANAVKLHSAPSLRSRHPTALAWSLAELAKCQFLAQPDQPRKAAETARRAVESWPTSEPGEAGSQMLRRDWSLYLLAAGDEKAAAPIIREQVSTADEESLDRNIGYGLAELCGMFVDRPADARPAAFQGWLTRALSLAPAYPNARWLAARVALEGGQTDQAVHHVKALQDAVKDVRELVPLLQTLASMYPDNAQFKAYVESTMSSLEQSVASEPASAPSDPGSAPGNPETGEK